MDEIYKEYSGLIPSKLIDDVKKEVSKVKITKAQLKEVLERVKREYEAALISPGEAIGIITAESFGEPATQMSIHRDEKIIVKIKDRIKILKIGEFVDKLMSKNGNLKFKDTEVLPLNNYEFYAPSINQEEKIEWKKIAECSRHKHDKKLMKLTTASGREIIATDNHSFVIRSNNEVIPIIGADLKIGNRIPVIKYLPENCINSIKINDYIDNVNESDDGLLSRYKTRAKNIPNKIILDRKFGYFIGSYLSEGHANNGQVSISNMNEDFIFNVKEFINDIGLDCKDEINSRGFALSRDLKISSSLLAQFIISICGSVSRNKKIPEFAYSAEEEFVSGLLRGYFDGDANFTVNRRMIRVSSNSKKLIDGIALLLNRFKIFSHKTKDKKEQFWLLIPYKYAPLFLQFVGSDIDKKRKSLERLAELSKDYWNDSSQDFTDMISGFGDLFYKTAKKIGMSTRYVNNFTKRQKIGRTTLFRYIKEFEFLSQKNKITISEELKIMRRMFESDVVWDEIKKIQYIDNDGFVYDLSVPGLETFTTFDGIITHNTLNVKHFAGVAEMQVTSGLPRLIEIFDASKSIKTPSMEVYLKQDYNKDAVKVRKIASQIKESTLGDIATEFTIDISAMNVKVAIDKEKLRDLGMTEDSLIKALKDSMKGIQIRSNKSEIVLKTKESDLHELYKLKEKAKEVFIKGVKGISYVLPVKREGEFIILTSGSNLKEILKVKEVDTKRTVTNDIHEVYSVFGVEATRQAIINESTKVIQNQGLDINIRHIMFIADVMTSAGSVMGITRSGITGGKESVLARASFETPIRHLISAALNGEEDYLNSVVENVILNQPVPLGTGLPRLVVKGMKEK